MTVISVLHDPLFTAEYKDRNIGRMGLLDLLVQADRIADLKAESCTGKCALYRFCIAFLSEVYALKDLNERADLVSEGRFDAEILNRFVASCEKEGISFDLDDAARPFMQAGFDKELDEKAEKPISKMLFDRPSGNNHVFNDHRLENEHEIDTAQAFEAMLETYMFCPAGLSGASNVNNTPPVYAFLHGGNLFETLVLNMVSEEEIGTIPYGLRESAWFRNEKIEPNKMTADMSFLKALTWQPRRITLKWDPDGMIRQAYIQNGLNFKGNGLWRDPHVIFRSTKEGDLITVKPSIGRELWRDTGSLLSNGTGARSTVPIQNVSDVWLDRPDDLDIEMTGLITSNEAILGRVSERLKMPKQLFDMQDEAQEFRSMLDIIETMYRSLVGAVLWQYCSDSERRDRKSIVADQAGEVFLQEMHDILFGKYMHALLGHAEGRVDTFFSDMRGVLNDALSSVVEISGNDVPSIKRQNAVRAKVRKDYTELKERSCGSNG